MDEVVVYVLRESVSFAQSYVRCWGKTIWSINLESGWNLRARRNFTKLFSLVVKLVVSNSKASEESEIRIVLL